MYFKNMKDYFAEKICYIRHAKKDSDCGRSAERGRSAEQ